MRPFETKATGKGIRNPDGRAMRRYERQFEAAMVKALDKLRRDVTRGITAENVHELVNRLNDEAIVRPFQDAIVKEIQAVALAGSEFGREQVEADVFGTRKALGVGMWELANNAAVQWALGYGYDLVRGIIATTRDRIALEVAEYVRNSETIGTLIARLSAGSMFSPVRAQMIAVTETTRAFQQGSLSSWKATEGIITGKEVRTNRDELVCPICSPKNGQIYVLDDPEGDPPFHVRCRCWSVPKVIEE